MKLYAIIDRKSEQVVNVFSSSSDETAERSFKMLLCQDPESLNNHNIFNLFYQDFDLYPVCEVNLEGLALRVSAHGMENVNKSSFRVDTFTVTDLIISGSSYSRSELAELSSFMFPKKDKSKEEVDTKGGVKDE